jgi:hypothetical protein
VYSDAIGLCSQSIDSILGSLVSTNGKGLYDHLKRSIFNYISDGFYMSTPIVKLEIIVIQNCNSQSKPKAQIVCGVRSAHNIATHLISFYHWIRSAQK